LTSAWLGCCREGLVWRAWFGARKPSHTMSRVAERNALKQRMTELESELVKSRAQTIAVIDKAIQQKASLLLPRELPTPASASSGPYTSAAEAGALTVREQRRLGVDRSRSLFEIAYAEEQAKKAAAPAIGHAPASAAAPADEATRLATRAHSFSSAAAPADATAGGGNDGAAAAPTGGLRGGPLAVLPAAGEAELVASPAAEALRQSVERRRAAAAAASAMFATRTAPVAIVGSVASGLALCASDVDMVVCMGKVVLDAEKVGEDPPLVLYLLSGPALAGVRWKKRNKKAKRAGWPPARNLGDLRAALETEVARYGFSEPRWKRGSRLLRLTHDDTAVTIDLWCDPLATTASQSQAVRKTDS